MSPNQRFGEGMHILPHALSIYCVLLH